MMRLEVLKNDWYGRLEDIVEEIEELGYEVLEANGEYITCWEENSDDDTEYIIRLGGTERTITVEEIREI